MKEKMKHNIISDMTGHQWKRSMDLEHPIGTMGSETAVEPFVQCWHPWVVL
jgi:hypothetical protein